MTDRRLDRLLQKCTVRLNTTRGQGTGFFVAPGLVLTCDHVLGRTDSESIQVFWKETQQKYIARVEKRIENPNVDLALLSLVDSFQGHPCVSFDSQDPEIGDNLYVFGYPLDESELYSGGESVTLEYEGDSFKDNNLFFKLKEGQIKEGSSGSPLLNLRSGGICGIITIARPSNLGGRAIPTKIIFREFPRLLELNRGFHKRNGHWIDNLVSHQRLPEDTAQKLKYQYTQAVREVSALTLREENALILYV